MKKLIIKCFFVIGLFWWAGTSLAWVYPEHREIMLIAIEKLSTYNRSILNNLWADARTDCEFRLSEMVVVPGQLLKPRFIDYAAWPAIAGDHACSSENMLHNILDTQWILEVADIAAELKIDLAFSKDRTERINSLRSSDIKLQSADPEYATRAGSNNVHFLISLLDVNMDELSYVISCIKEGAELNAMGAYALYHYSALLKAARLANGTLTPEERSDLSLSALADEAFAIHFLEDAFAAGHVAGTWGDASQRKGTHDYYNEMGLRTSTWVGEKVVLTGDAWMRNEDAVRAAYAVRLSIEQLLNTSQGKYSYVFSNNEQVPLTVNDFNVCQKNYMPSREKDSEFESLLREVLIYTPVPTLVKGLGDLPRFRAEVGTFIGFSPALRGSLINGGFGIGQETIGAVGGIEFGARFGVGLEGVLNESGDGLVFLEVGWRQDGSSSTGVVNAEETSAYGNLLAAIPGRSAYNLRLRLPFYLIPGDLLLAGPILFFIDRESLTDMAVTAVNGGLIGWEAGIETSFGRFQFVLGREMAVYFFGRTKEKDALFNFSPDASGYRQLYILSYESTQFEFPIVEYRPFRSFSTDQSSSMLIQLYGGFDIPSNVQDITVPGEPKPVPQLNTVWYAGLRVIFDWRHYL